MGGGGGWRKSSLSVRVERNGWTPAVATGEKPVWQRKECWASMGAKVIVRYYSINLKEERRRAQTMQIGNWVRKGVRIEKREYKGKGGFCGR